jgi:DNA-binding NarL/FixJ family response regulator
MNIRCLIIDRNSIFRDKVGKFIEAFGDDFQVQATENVNEAIDAIASTEISLVLCEPRLTDPKTRLVACIKDKEPAVPLIITGQDDSPHLTELLALGFVKGSIPRPDVQPAELAGKVVLALGSLFYQGNLRGVNCISLTQILDQEYGDCLVRVINTEENVEGLLFLKNGMLLDAICGSAAAIDAVKRIFSWKSADVELFNICPLSENRINKNMACLVLQCTRNQQPGESSSPVAGKEMPPKTKNTNPSKGGLAGLFLKKASKK